MRQFFGNVFGKEDIVTAGVVIFCLVLYAVFPTSNVFQQIISSIVFLLVIPLLYVKIILKKKVSTIGIQKGKWKTGLAWSVLSLAITVSVAYILFKYFSFSQKYAIPTYIAHNFPVYLAYEILLVGFFAILYDFFFRGFLMFSFSRKIGIWSVLLQSLVFLALMYFSGSLHWTTTPYLIFVLFSGIIVYLSDSIWYAFAAFMVFSILFDSLFIYAVK
jgi:membrane protease YdiL (CAAX protease family)